MTAVHGGLRAGRRAAVDGALRGAAKVVALMDETLHAVRLRLRVMQLRRDPTMRQKLDAAAIQNDQSPAWGEADFDRYLAQLNEQHDSVS